MQTQDDTTTIEQTPETVSAIYVDLPAKHDGQDLEWFVKRETATRVKWSQYPQRGIENRNLGNGFGFEWTEEYSEFFLILKYGDTTRIRSIEDILDKDIVAASKAMIADKERDFRLQLLAEGAVPIWPKKMLPE